MTGLPLALILFAAGLVLLLAEIALPAHGVLGIAGAATVVAGIGVVFYHHQWAGAALAVGLTAATPFVVGLWLKIWPRTPMGRRLILTPPAPSAANRSVAASGVQVGQTGITVAELRPGGTCEFDGERLAARAEVGTIPRGASVRVIAIVDGHPVVRPA
jgi:membrane-bound ClpP family serine protease